MGGGWPWFFLFATLHAIVSGATLDMFLIPIYEGTVVLNGSIAGYLVLRDYRGADLYKHGLLGAHRARFRRLNASSCDLLLQASTCL